jgi:hypothetical protein
MAMHQTARFLVKPMQSHKLVIMQIGRYLCDNTDRGIIYNVDRTKGLEVHADADFAGGWSAADWDNADNFLSKLALLFVMQTVQWYGAASFRLRLHFLLQRLSILLCLMLCVRLSQFKISSKRSNAFLLYQIQWLTSASHFMKTIYLQLLWQNLWGLPLAQSILPSIIITFAAELIHLSTNQVISRLSTSQPRNSLRIYLLNQLMVITSLHYTRCYVEGDN